MRLKNKIEVAKVGTWNGFKFTPDLLKDLAKNTAGQKMPITRGHIPEAGEISQGYITNPEIINDGLFYDQFLDGDLADDWESDKFINRSLTMNDYNGKYMISSLALLGAEAPGIKGLKTFKEKESTKYVFTEKIKNEEPNMAEFKEGFVEGQDAKEKELTLKFAEDLKAKEKELTLKFSEDLGEAKKESDSKIKELQDKIAEIETKAKDELKTSFSEKIKVIVKDLPEKEQKTQEEKLLKFSEKFDNLKEFSEMIGIFAKKDTKVTIPVVQTFSETTEEVDEYNTKAM